MIPDFDALAERRRQERRIPGLAVAVLSGDDVATRGFGSTRIDRRVPVTPRTIFELASITKTFLAITTLRLIEQGTLTFETPIADVVAGLPGAWCAVTIEHVLRHQSGIPSYTNVPAYWQSTAKVKSAEEILDLVRALPLEFEPGARYAYDNTGFHLLWMALEAVTARSVAALFAEHVCEPAGMKQTRIATRDGCPAEKAEPAALVDGVVVRPAHYDPSNAPYNVESTLEDMVAFDRALGAGKLVSDATRKKMWTAVPSRAGNERAGNFSTGLGWFTFSLDAGRFAGHNGETSGYTASYGRWIDAGVSVVALANLSPLGDFHALAWEIADLVLGAR